MGGRGTEVFLSEVEVEGEFPSLMIVQASFLSRLFLRFLGLFSPQLRAVPVEETSLSPAPV